jgi:hypothetical protein
MARKVRVFDTATGEEGLIPPSSGGGAITSATPPESPSDGQAWLNTTNGQVYYWWASQSVWVAGGAATTLGGVASAVAYGPTTPADWTTDPETVEEALDELAARESGGSSSGWTLIDEGTVSNVLTMTEDGCFTDDYQEYELVFINTKTDVATATVVLQLRDADGDIDKECAFSAVGRSTTPADLATQYGAGNVVKHFVLYGSDGTGTNQNANVVFRLWPRESSELRITSHASGRAHGGAHVCVIGSGCVIGHTTGATGFKLRPNVGVGSYTFDVGTWRLFGR